MPEDQSWMAKVRSNRHGNSSLCNPCILLCYYSYTYEHNIYFYMYISIYYIYMCLCGSLHRRTINRLSVVDRNYELPDVGGQKRARSHTRNRSPQNQHSQLSYFILYIQYSWNVNEEEMETANRTEKFALFILLLLLFCADLIAYIILAVPTCTTQHTKKLTQVHKIFILIILDFILRQLWVSGIFIFLNQRIFFL